MIRKICVVDDDLIYLKTLNKMVLSLGFEALLFNKSDEAFAYLKTTTDIDLLITDFNMPVLNGKELVLELRKCDSFKKLPVIIVSGVIDGDDINSLDTPFLAKPVWKFGLRNMIAKIELKAAAMRQRSK